MTDPTILEALVFLLRQDARRARVEGRRHAISDAERWERSDETVVAQGLIDRLLAVSKETA